MDLLYAHPVAAGVVLSAVALLVAVIAVEADGLADRISARRRPSRRGGMIL